MHARNMPDHSTTLLSWTTLFGTTSGVAATLCGFIAVALSVNLKSILASSQLVIRAGELLFRQFGSLIVSLLMLLPDGWSTCRSATLLIVTALLWFASTVMEAKSRPSSDVAPTHVTYLRLVWGQIVAVLLFAGALGVFFGQPSGALFIALGVIASFLLAVAGAWTLLIEILR
jgi:hypothetical protein